jgi:predicted CoA-binding protein
LGKGASAIAADLITEILTRSRAIAVVGLSSRQSRPSYRVSEYMRRAGYRIFPVNPNETEVLGVRSVPRLEDLAERMDIVNIFRRSEDVPEIVESAIAIGARTIWMQEGVIHHPAAARARQAGLAVVMDLCIMKEHARRFPLL